MNNMAKRKKKKEFSTSDYVAGSLVAGNVAGTFAQSTGSSTGSTMTANMMTGASKPIVPVMKIKGATMIIKPLAKLKKKGLKAIKFKGGYNL